MSESMNATNSTNLGRLFYEWKAAKANPTHPWCPWDRLHPWERDREEVTARSRAKGCWALEHTEAEWPPPEDLTAYAVETVERWGAWR